MVAKNPNDTPDLRSRVAGRAQSGHPFSNHLTPDLCSVYELVIRQKALEVDTPII